MGGGASGSGWQEELTQGSQLCHPPGLRMGKEGRRDRALGPGFCFNFALLLLSAFGTCLLRILLEESS